MMKETTEQYISAVEMERETALERLEAVCRERDGSVKRIGEWNVIPSKIVNLSAGLEGTDAALMKKIKAILSKEA